MKIIYQLDQLKDLGPTVVTVGNFDGVHLAHVRVLKEVTRRALELGMCSVALTFDPHPVRFLRPESRLKLITTYPDKMHLLEQTGIDYAVVLPFTQPLSARGPGEFIRDIVQSRLKAAEVHEGFNFRFGCSAAGDATLLTDLGRNLGFGVKLYPEMRIRNLTVSSTQIRQLIGAGDVALARHLLGRPFSIHSTTQSGRGYGSKFTVPTINLAAYQELLPKNGVYITRTVVGNESFNSVTNIGNRPTFGQDSFAVETHLLNFHPLEVIETTQVTVCFLNRLRDEIKFPTVEILRKQIARDVKKTERFFALWSRLEAERSHHGQFVKTSQL